MTKTLVIETFISNHCSQLGLSRPDFIPGVGYKNVSKGLRRLGQLYAGHVSIPVSAAVSRLSGIAFYSRQAKLALLHLNARAVSPLTQAEAQLIARDWKVFEYT